MSDEDTEKLRARWRRNSAKRNARIVEERNRLMEMDKHQALTTTSRCSQINSGITFEIGETKLNSL